MTATTEITTSTTTTAADRFRVWSTDDPGTSPVMAEAMEHVALDVPPNPNNRFALAERDLLHCSLRPGDTVQVINDRADSASVSAGEVFKVAEPWSYGSTDVVKTTYGWVFRRSNVRLVEPVEARADLSVERLSWFDATIGVYSTTCGCARCASIRGGVDDMYRHITESGPVEYTPELKEALGSEMRRARHIIALRLKDGSDALAQAVAEEVPERNLTREASPDPDLLALRARVEELEIQLRASAEREGNVRQRRDELSRWQSSAIADTEIISERLTREARSRGWCSEYDDIVDAINRNMSVLALAPRNKKVTGTVTGYIRVPFSYQVSDLEVEADSDVEEALTEHVTNEVSPRDIGRAADIDWYSAEFDEDGFEVDGWEYE